MNDGKITAAKLQACVPYTCPRGNFLQLPFTSIFEIAMDNTLGTEFLSVPGQEQNAPPKYDFLIHAISALVSLPYTYMRIQWPDGHFLSNTPVDIWSMMQTGRNGRLFEGFERADGTRGGGKFIEKNSVIRMDWGTSQTSAIVTGKVYFEGALLIPA
jgi:hypothetical protein